MMTWTGFLVSMSGPAKAKTEFLHRKFWAPGVPESPIPPYQRIGFRV